MNPSDDQISHFFFESIAKTYDDPSMKGLEKLCESYQDLLLYEYLMRPHVGDKVDQLYRLLTDTLFSHESASLIRYENGGTPIYEVTKINKPEPISMPLWGTVLSHQYIVKEVDHAQVIDNCKNLLSQSPKNPDNPMDDVYSEFIRVVAKASYMQIDLNNDSFGKVIQLSSSMFRNGNDIPVFDLLYVNTLVFLFLRQSNYLIDYLFFWSLNIEYWLKKNNIKRVQSVYLASELLEFFQGYKNLK